ncbi:hypothetical protein C8R45DRAFT_1016052 [Mycena sanguinolenta]|nr:hypothetical protein C8R45DRAFT_1016052 [Mycena sanguinolenta]
MQCCDVLTGREVWTHAKKNACFTSWELMVEMLHDGHTAIFVLHDTLPHGMKHEFSIVKVDLTTGVSDELSHLDFNTKGGLLYSPIISGDFLALGLTRNRDRMIVVINWRERKYVVLASEYSDAAPKNYMAIVAGHIILAIVAHEPPHELQMVAYPLRSFASRWRSLDELIRNTDLPPPEIRIDPKDIVPVMVERLEHNNRVLTVFPSRDLYFRAVMRLYVNPIRDDAYKLMVYTSPTGRTHGNHSFGGEAGRPVMFNYTLNVGTDLFSCKKVSSFTTVPDVSFPLSYAGYAVVSPSDGSFRTTTRIVDPRLTDRLLTKWTGQAMREVVVVSKQPIVARLSATGIMLVSKQDQVEVYTWI